MPALDPDTLAALLAPVPGDAPAGRDLRYDARYDAVREARREDVELPQGGLATERKLADWAQVQQATATLLASESKDLNLAAWHAEARLKRAGLSGLASGLTVIQGLLEEYWDGLYPQLDEGDPELRLGPLEWVGSRLDLPVREVPVAQGGLTFAQHRDSRTVPTDGEAGADGDRRKLREEKLREGKIAPEAADAALTATPKAFYKGLVADATAALAALDALERTSEERFPDDPPSYRALRLALDEVHRFATTTLAQKLEADPDPIEVEAGLGEDGLGALGVAGTGSGAPAAGGALAPEPVDRNDAAAHVAVAARFLRQQDATAPAPYLLLRGLRWGEVRSVTGQLDPKLLDAPAPAVRTRLKTLLLDGKWPELLEQGELAMATPAGRGWLDLQRYVLTACARLGPSYDAVATAVRTELAAYLAAVPQLLETTLMDDTPTSNEETLNWLAAEGLDGAMPTPTADDGRDGADSELPDGSAALAAALDGELEGDALAAAVRGSAARRTTGRRRADRLHAAARNGDGVDPFTLAKAELARGRTNRAIELLAAEMERERSARGRFVRETQMVQIMVEAGLAEVAQPILQRLVELIEAKSLADWEAGPLVAQPLVLLCRVIDALDSGSRERDELYLKVCRLDPLQAIALRRPA